MLRADSRFWRYNYQLQTRVVITDLSLAFFNVNFRFQSNVCDGCHDLLQKAMSFKEVAGFSVKGNTYRSFGAWVEWSYKYNEKV